MAYTDIPTVSVGDLYTASDFNTYLRDNFRAGIPDAFTAKGDIAFGEDADTIGILALGNAGDWLTCDAGETLGVKWAAPVSFFDWFTFGAFTCASLDNDQAPTTAFSVDVSTSFGIDNSGGKHAYLCSFTVERDTTFTQSGYQNPWMSIGTAISSTTTPLETWMLNRVHGDSDEANWYKNTQSGIIVSDTRDIVYIYSSHNIADISLTLTLKIWGWA